MTPSEAKAIATLCKLPGLVEHGNAIRIALANESDCAEAIGDAWAAAQAIATFAMSHGFPAEAMKAQAVADAIAARADAEDTAARPWAASSRGSAT